MAGINDTLPEGTDSIINGASSTGDDSVGTSSYAGVSTAPSTGSTYSAGGADYGSGAAGSAATGAKAKLADAASGLKGQAADKAREIAVQGKDRATEALDNISRLVSDAAASVDERVGPQYGAYARQAADAVASLASTLRDKDVDDLFEDARSAVRKSPAIAIGAAAAIGFLIARVAKAGVTPAAETTDSGPSVTSNPVPAAPYTPATPVTPTPPLVS